MNHEASNDGSSTPGGGRPTGTREPLPRIGLGTWGMGENPGPRTRETDALRLGLDLGARLIDTAEMYGEGTAEEIVGDALAGCTVADAVTVVSKAYPWNAGRDGIVAAAERSLRRLRRDRIDLYLLHWPGSHPLEETLEGFRRLREAGKIGAWGVSNFDAGGMERLLAVCGDDGPAANQILYNLARRGPERRLIPWCRQQGIEVMAYSPLEQARLPEDGVLAAVARRRSATPYQVALAWTLREPGIIAIPKAVEPAHVRDNLAAASLTLEPVDLAELDTAFPAPPTDVPLETL